MLVHFSEPFSHKNNVRHCLLSAWFGLTYFQSCCDAKASQQGSCKCLLSDTRERERERERERKRSTAIVLLRNRHDILVNTWSLLSTFPDSHISSRLTRPFVVDYGVQNSALAIIQLPGRSIYLSYTQYISPALKKQFLCYFSGKTTNSGIKITIFVFI